MSSPTIDLRHLEHQIRLLTFQVRRAADLLTADKGVLGESAEKLGTLAARGFYNELKRLVEEDKQAGRAI